MSNMENNKTKKELATEKNKDPLVFIKKAAVVGSVVIVALLIGAAMISMTLFWVLLALFAAAIFAILFVAGKGCVGPLVPLGMWAVGRTFKKKYGEHPAGEIVFYGASNFTYWKTLEEDMLPYHAQNHGFGGSYDQLMMKQADKFLYPYKPSVVFIQTGSNDNVNGVPLEQIMENKRKMYAQHHENLPDAKIVVMSGLPLPGRTRHWDSINELNKYLEEYCNSIDYLEFINATPLMMTEDGGFRPDYFVKDGIHLNEAGHAVWTQAMKDKLAEMGIEP